MISWANVRLLVTDFDGVWTDDAVYVDQHSTESVRCLRADGYGVTRLMAAGVPVIVLSAEVNPVVAVRCAKLRVDCTQGLDGSVMDKRGCLNIVSSGYAVPLSEIAYIGNDVNDEACLRAVGHPVVVCSAEEELFQRLGISVYGPEPRGNIYVTNRSGGYGALREVCDLILEARNARP